MSLLNLLDIKKMDDGIGFDIIEESISAAPELRVIPAETIMGTDMQLTVRTGLPTVAFRNYNEGSARSKSTYETRLFQTMILDHQVAVDMQLVDSAKDPARVLENHMVGAVEAAFRKVGTQFYYGGTTTGDKGFPGLLSQYNSASTHVVDATGSTAKTSVWMLRIARETIQFLFGNNTTIGMNSEWKVETLYDGSSNPYQAYTNWLTGRVGLRQANKNAAVRIKNVGTDSGKGLTDDLLYSAYQKFYDNMGAEPTHIFCNSRSLEQLRAARTNTGSNERGVPATLPSDWNGLPIIKTQQITNSES